MVINSERSDKCIGLTIICVLSVSFTTTKNATIFIFKDISGRKLDLAGTLEI